MIGFLLIVCFPLVLGLGFGSLYMVVYATGRDAAVIDRAGFVLYPLLLLLPLAFCLVPVWRGDQLAAVGLQAPQLAGLGSASAVAASLVGGAVVGVLLFYNELWVGRLSQRLTQGLTKGRGGLNRLLEGASESFAEEGQGVSRAWTLALSVFVVAAEEFLWRGYLMTYLDQRFGLAVVWVVVLSSLSFGLNHYYFGLRNVLLKSFAGAVWALLFLATGSLLASFASHYAFEVLVWLRMQR
ncbi:MAG: CPBP family intramembrane glutamic endopeptidase [Acidobacteriota bacterium]|nr:CPBP family intramembrane glutamic endopeptidase [Acidobacteriota bacterium]